MNTKIFSANFFKQIRPNLVLNIGTILIVAAMLFVNNVYASKLNASASPSTISYQGTLTNAGGTPVNATLGLTVSLYNVQSGGTPLWTEAHTGTNAVPINNGAFNMRLGGITPIPSSVWDNPAVYLGIQVEGDSVELSPREVVDAVPYAMNASGSFTIPDGSITTAKIVDGAVTSEKITPTYWNIVDQVNDSWTTNISGQYVAVPGFEFTFTPQTNGVVFASLGFSLNHTAQNTIMNCAIFVNTMDDTGSKAGVVQLSSASIEENCTTDLVYQVNAGTTYHFFAAVYSNTGGTITIHKKPYSRLFGIFWGR